MFMFIRILIILLLYCLPLKADQYDVRLEQLFNRLLETDKEEEINNITLNIWEIWLESNDSNIENDFYEGLKSMRKGDLQMSVVFFTRVIEKKPTFAEAWNKRATVYYMLGKFDKSMFDINETLKLEPRHFGAMDGMVLILLHQQEYEKAIEIYEQILKIFPKSKSTLEKKEHLAGYITKSA